MKKALPRGWAFFCAHHIAPAQYPENLIDSLQITRQQGGMAGTGYNILINRRSGTVLNMGEPAVQKAIETSGIAVEELCLAEPTDMQAELARLAALDTPLIVGGGDGTIRDCSKYLSEQQKAFGVLPLGTMNLLAHDLNINTLQDALNAYAGETTTEAIDAGFVNGEIFLCCASIGTMPQASVFREAQRKANNLLLFPQMFLFIMGNLDKHKRERTVLDIDGEMKRFRTPAVVVSVNRFADSEKLTESNFKRGDLTGGELAAYISTTKTATAHLRLIGRLLFGHWLKDPDLAELTGARIKLWSRHKRALVSIDGEVDKMRTPLVFTLKPKHVKLLIPSPDTKPN